MQQILSSRWDYTLYKSEDKIVLSVLCGMSGMYEITTVLSADQVKLFNDRGEEFIKELSKNIRDKGSLESEAICVK
ncbi:MAG: hypothetical protein N4A72_08890 [Bacteroidales bacterium]|jgi:hypothetical protein|nr:hypothetical protein [Bacteroidales bacterium]